MKLLRLFALGLQIDSSKGGEEYFSSRHDPLKGPSGRVLRLLHVRHPVSQWRVRMEAMLMTVRRTSTLLLQRMSPLWTT